MRVMVIVKATADSEAGLKPSAETTKMFEDMGKFNQELIEAGIMAGEGMGLKPSSAGRRVHFDGPTRSVTDGPFSATNELVAGFWIWKVKDLDEAEEWVKKCPNPMFGPSDIEIRPVYELEDFGDLLPPEVVESEKALQAQTSGA